jgi:hypothetical protein
MADDKDEETKTILGSLPDLNEYQLKLSTAKKNMMTPLMQVVKAMFKLDPYKLITIAETVNPPIKGDDNMPETDEDREPPFPKIANKKNK